MTDDDIQKKADATRERLDEIPEYWANMQPRPANTDNGPRPAPGSRVLIDVDRLDLARGADLWHWCLLVIDEMSYQDEDERIVGGSPDARDPTIHQMCAFLSRSAEWIITYNNDFPKAIKQLHHAYRKAAGIRREITYHCPSCEWRVNSEDRGAWFRCTGCGRTWTLAAEIDRLMAAQEAVMTLGQIAKETGQSARTLRHWAKQGRFLPVGQRHGRPVYDIRHVRRASERVTKETRRSA